MPALIKFLPSPTKRFHHSNFKQVMAASFSSMDDLLLTENVVVATTFAYNYPFLRKSIKYDFCFEYSTNYIALQ
jgi:hypothetical protein